MYPAGLWTAASLSLLSFLRIVLKHLKERFSFVFCNRVLDINNYFLHFEFQLFVVVLLDESFSYCHSKSILVILLLNYQGLVGTEIMCSFRGTYNNLREVQIQLLIVFYMSIFTEYIYVNYIQKRILFWICKLIWRFTFWDGFTSSKQILGRRNLIPLMSSYKPIKTGSILSINNVFFLIYGESQGIKK